MQAATHKQHTIDEQQMLRADLYRLLGALLAAPPTAETLVGLRQLEVIDTSTPLAQSVSALVPAAIDADAKDLAAAYTQLFIGVGRGELVPYASWYSSGFVMDKSLARLREDLKRLGFAREEEVREPEDHVAALCDLMNQLIDSDEPADLDTQRRFFVNHLLPWLPRFFAELQQAESTNAFYRAVGQFGEQLIKEEKQYLEGIS